MSAAVPILAMRLPFGFRREMAKRFGYIEPYGRKGGFCVRFTIEGRIHRITSMPVPTGTRRIRLATREMAEEILDEIRVSIRRDGDTIAAISPYMGKSKLLGVERRWDEFCAVQRQRMDAGQISKRRVEELEGHLSRGHLRTIREMPMMGVDYAALEVLQLDLFAQSLAPATVHHALADVRTFFRWCARRKMISAVPEIPHTQLDEYEPTIPSAAEQRSRLASIPDAARGYFLIRGLLGVRHQEALRARISDYRRGEWNAERQRWTDEISIRAKGRRFRVLPVPSDLAAWVREYRPALAEVGEPLFTNPTHGRAWSMASLVRVWRAMEKDLGLAHVKPNEALRHCFGTRTAERLIGQGMSRDEAQSSVMRIMGHVSRVTSDRYLKLAAETLRGVVE